MNPVIYVWDILCQNQARIAHLKPKQDCFGNFTSIIFNLRIVPYHAAKFGKNFSRQACVILGQNSVKMFYLAQNRIFCDILFKRNLPIYCGLSRCKIKKISLEQILREACINLEHNWDKITHLAQKKNFLEIPFKLLYLFIMLYHAANFRNNLQQKS